MNLAGAVVCEGIFNHDDIALLTVTFDRDLGAVSGALGKLFATNRINNAADERALYGIKLPSNREQN
jgi:hypothetical protein